MLAAHDGRNFNDTFCVKTYLLRVTGWKFHSTSLPSFEKDVQCTDPLEARDPEETGRKS